MRDLARLITGQGPLNWDIAKEMAQAAATGGEPENNPDPVGRVRLEELLRVAELHVSEATGLQVAPGGLLTVQAVTPSEWAVRTLEDWKPLLERLATGMIPKLQDTTELSGPEGEGESDAFGSSSAALDPMSKAFANLPQTIAPLLLGIQAGSMVGQLASQAMGQYDLPMPRPPGNSLIVVANSVDRFAQDWSLEPDEVRMWVCLREATNHAVLGRPHVRARLEDLIGSYVDAFDPAAPGLMDRLTDFDPADLSRLPEMFSDPETLLGEMQSDEQRRIQVPLQALLAALVGYVDHIMDTVGRRLIASYGPLTEALRRRRLEDGPGTRLLGQLLGVSLDAGRYEQGEAFIQGIVERAGDTGLERLWRSAQELPTPAELDAPGLWLARIDLDQPPEA